jgi:hypothetical protein
VNEQRFMKFEREKDIPAFKGKNWRERMALRYAARGRDPYIAWISTLIGIISFVPSFLLARWVGPRFFPHHWYTAFVVIYLVLAYSILYSLKALFVTPRIRKATESEAKPLQSN